MQKELPVVVFDENLGAQYHNFLLFIILTKESNKYFVYENYIELSVKHWRDAHIDFSYDGIYACNHTMLQQLIFRGPMTDLHSFIKQSIDSRCYVIMNINEQFLPNRQSYHRDYFRHDILISGYDIEEGEYITVGIDEHMHYKKDRHRFVDIEKAYYSMQNEWDYEIFLFRFNETYSHKKDKEQIIRHLKNYCKGENPGLLYCADFLNNRRDTPAFVYSNYVGEYYGIEVYTYLMERIKKQYKFLSHVTEEDKLGVLELRAINVLKSHCKLIRRIQEELLISPSQESTENFIKIEKKIEGVKLLLLKYFSEGQKKDCKKAVERLKQVKDMEFCAIMQLVQLLSQEEELK